MWGPSLVAVADIKGNQTLIEIGGDLKELKATPVFNTAEFFLPVKCPESANKVIIADSILVA